MNNHPDLFPYLATQMGPDIWDIMAVAEKPDSELVDQARDRVWQGKTSCYIVEAERTRVYAPGWIKGGSANRPAGGWILRITCDDGVDQERAEIVRRYNENLSHQLDPIHGPRMFLEEPGQGVKLTFYDVIIKMDSLTRSDSWGWDAFIGYCAEHGYIPVTDGRLVSLAAMNRADLNPLVDELLGHNLQYEEYPVDFYRTEAGEVSMFLFGPMSDSDMFTGRRLDHAVIRSPHDHEIRLHVRKSGGIWARRED